MKDKCPVCEMPLEFKEKRKGIRICNSCYALMMSAPEKVAGVFLARAERPEDKK